MEKQLDKSHYQFSKYVSKKRWAIIWHQIQEVVSLAPENILKIGPGPDIFKQILSHLGFSVDTVDVDPELKPDFVATAGQLPFKNNSYDCVCRIRDEFGFTRYISPNLAHWNFSSPNLN